MDLPGLDQIVLSEYPYPIAVNYRRLLETEGWEARTRKCIELFEFGVRAITLGALSQYLIRDVNHVHDPELDRKLVWKLARAPLGAWVDFLFLTICAYDGQAELFFMPELYECFWDTTRKPHRYRKGVRAPFDQLVRIRNDLAHYAVLPKDENDWEKHGRQAIGHLRTILGYFSFLQDYDLVRVLGREGDEYRYERYTGQSITRHQGKLCGETQDLKEKWFYLCRESRSVLSLHPLLVSLFSGIELADGQQQDAALFAELLEKSVGYTAIVVREKVSRTDPELVEQWWELLGALKERIAAAKRRDEFSWSGVRQAAAELTTIRMGSARKKYRADLYLPREELLAKFRKFLNSDKGCFVLTGRSGVGKSSFVLSLVDAFADREDVSLLMYDAAQLAVPESMVQAISQDLALYLTKGEINQDLFKDLDQCGQMAGRLLIVVFDAINENSMGHELLRQIDRIVREVRYPWLKVVVTSRPQAWRTLKKGLPLAVERYYVEWQGERSWEEELTVKLEPFQSEELPQVYEKYRQGHELQTRFGDLRPSIQSALQDPFVLRVVAEIHKGRPIAEQIQVFDIYEQYISALLASGRLDRSDLTLLTRELMPLMLGDGQLADRVTASEIHGVQTWDGRPLWELIENTDPFSSGKLVNASFGRLVDAEILADLGPDLDYTIRFEYDRFYEFFAGRRIREIAQQVPGFYEQVGPALSECVFLWGAMANALTFELLDGNTEQFLELAPSAGTNRLLRSALVTALTQFGQKAPEKARNFIKELVGELTPPPRTLVQAAWRLRPARKSLTEPPAELLARQSIAIEAAANLEMADFLQQVAAEGSPAARDTAALHIFYLYGHNRQKGLEAVEGLSGRAVGTSGFPDVAVAFSLIGIFGALLGQERDPATLNRLLEIGRRTVRRLLLLGDTSQRPTLPRRIGRSAIGLLRRQLLRILANRAANMMRAWRSGAWFSYDGIAHVFALKPDQKQKLATLIPLLDGTYPGLVERTADLLEAESWGDMMGQVIVDFPFFTHVVADPEATLPALEVMVDAAVSERPPTFWAYGPVTQASSGAIRLRNPSPRLLELHEKVAAAIQEDPESWVNKAKTARPVRIDSDSRASCLYGLIALSFVVRGRVQSPVLDSCLKRAMESRDDDYLKLFVNAEVSTTFELGLYEAAYQALELLADYASPDVRDELVKLLVRIHRAQPEVVEGWLLQERFPKEVVNLVLASPPSETVSDTVTYQLLAGLYDLFLTGPRPLIEEVQWLLMQTLKLSSVQEWFEMIGKELLNLLTGEAVFRVPEDAPSRRFLLQSDNQLIGRPGSPDSTPPVQPGA